MRCLYCGEEFKAEDVLFARERVGENGMGQQEMLNGQGAVGGSGGKLLPNDTITCAQVAKILCLLY